MKKSKRKNRAKYGDYPLARRISFELQWNWSEHIERVRPSIAALDRRTVTAMARAREIAVTN